MIKNEEWKGTTSNPISFSFTCWTVALVLIRYFPQDGSLVDISIYIYISCHNVCVLIKLEGRNICVRS